MATLAAALVLSVAGAAEAQPFGPHGGPGGDGIARLLMATKASLKLDTSQQLAWDNAVAHARAARAAARSNRQQVVDALKAELAKPAPDLAAVAAISDQVAQQNQALLTPVRNEWLNLYATFTPEQKGLVRDGIQKRMARAARFRQHLRERLQQGSGGNG